MTTISQPSKTSQHLKKNHLSYPEVIAQSISVIAPSTAPAAILGLIFVSAGNGTWLSFVLATVGLLFVCFNINQFARRSASPGSLYTYIVKGLGPMAGVLSGWGLLLGYMVTGMSTLCGFGIFANMLLAQAGIHLPMVALFALCVIVSFGVAYKDIKLSAKMMLIFEGVSIIFILVLGVAIWVHKGFAIDMSQITLHGSTPGVWSPGSSSLFSLFPVLRVPPPLGLRRKTRCERFPDQSFRARRSPAFFFSLWLT